MFGSYEVRDLSVSVTLDFVDLKTLLECGSGDSTTIMQELGICWNIEQINAHFPFLKQIQEVSDSILRRLKMFDLQMTGSIIPVKDSPVWYGLVDEKSFLDRNVGEMNRYERKVGLATRRD